MGYKEFVKPSIRLQNYSNHLSEKSVKDTSFPPQTHIYGMLKAPLKENVHSKLNWPLIATGVESDRDQWTSKPVFLKNHWPYHKDAGPVGRRNNVTQMDYQKHSDLML